MTSAIRIRRAPRALLLTLALLVPAAIAQTDADKPLFDYREIKLDNGLRVVTLEDFSCPIVAVHLWYHVGSRNEDPQRQGFAHMFEHMMFRGTDRLGPTDHFDYIRRVGGDCNAYTSFDQTVYVQTLPANQLELALWLEAERMSFLKIDQGNFDTERKVVEEERRMGLNRPYGDLPDKLIPQMGAMIAYQWTPIGNIAHLRSASVAELRDFWTRFYVPNNATLVVVGAVHHDEAQALAKKCFGWIPRYPDPQRPAPFTAKLPENRDIVIKADNAPAPIVGILYRGVPIASEDGVPLRMLASILGGGDSSRLHRKLVADDRTAVAAMAVPFSLEVDGIMAAAAVLSPIGGDTKKAKEALLAEIERIRSQPVSEEELTKARNQMLSGLVTQNLTVVSKATALGQAAVLEGDTSHVNQMLDQVRKVTVADLQRVAQKYMAPDLAVSITIERNLLGTLFGKKTSDEENAPITATPETEAPPPGRAGLTRPADFAAQPPLAGLLSTDPTPKFETEQLPNGLKVIVVRNSEVPYVTVSLNMPSGAWTEGKPGAAALAMDMLTKGTSTRTEAQLAQELDSYAISLSGNAGMDSTSVSLSCLTENLEHGMTLLADVTRRPKFDESEFEKLRQQTRTQLAISTATPEYMADREARKHLYGQHPYGRSATGEVDDIDKLSVADAQTWWSNFVRPEKAALVFAGDIDMKRAKELAVATLGDWKLEAPVPTVKMPPIPAPTATHIYLVDRPGVQAQIRASQIGMTRHDDRFFTAQMLSGYFGGAFNSRLNETIRVKKGLTYGARGGFGAQRNAGSFTVSTFSKIETTAEAVRAIFDELKRLQEEPPTTEELEKTKSYELGSFAGDRETPQAVAGDLWMIESQGLPADYFGQMLKSFAATTPEDCAKLAKSAIDPSKMVVVVVGPAAQLKDELEKIAPVTVVKDEPGDTDEDDK